MITATAIFLTLNCPETKIINKTKAWIEHDSRILRVATKRCPELYKDSPCLKYFMKMREREYRAICGRPQE